MARTISFSYGTKKGRKHENNEDSILVIEQDDIFVFGVFDGISGLHDGANASKAAMEFIRSSIFTEVNSAYIKKHPKECLLTLIEGAHKHIQQFEGNDQMGTTATLCLIDSDGYLHTVHVGDSPIFLAAERHFAKLSDDDSICGRLTKYLGMPGELDLNSAYCKRKVQNGILVLCTDGLTDGAEDNWLINLSGIRINENTASMLIDKAYDNSCSGDDISLILVSISGDDIPLGATQESQAAATGRKTTKGWNIMPFLLVFIIGILIGTAIDRLLTKNESELHSPEVDFEQIISEPIDTINTYNYEYE